MTKRKFSTAFHRGPGTLSGFFNPMRGVRQFRRARHPHFSFSALQHTMDVDMSSNRNSVHEAHMIPGVDGKTTFGFPNSIITKLRYSTFGKLTAAAGVVTSQTFRANSIHDPDFTNTGHQPLYHDQWAAIYDQYVVLGAQIKVTFTSSSSLYSNIVGIVGDDDSTTSSNLETLMEQNDGYSTVVGAAGAPPVTITATFSPQEMFGVDAKSDGSSQTSFGSNPTEEWYWKIYSIYSDAETTTTTYYKADIEYTVKMSELKTPTQS